jgi:benzil reductase ((S)-benzoin forming)
MNLYFITGTTKGIGKALAEQLASDANNEVVTFSRRPDGVAGASFHAMDLTQPAQVAPAFMAALKACKARRGDAYASITLYNNAGVVAPVGPLSTNDAASVDDNLRVNLTSPMILMGAFIAATAGMSSKRLVVNISSGAGKRPIAGWSAYCAAKAGIDMATRVAGIENTEPGLIVCSLAPGVVDTPMQAQVRSASETDFPDVARFKAMKTDGVLRAPEDVAAQIVALEKGGKFTHGGIHDIREMG